ncbi:MAG: HAD-IIB family hydrolase, partial [candidate division Zixibacteria bacterium]|nr:HAD-IIB family hydrolase [candidate division Zixibacteria bacterium]NIR67521.1 HAD-IIB family hydrolase [candidate division Zixibacteria bacterium]NIS48788.1 HAD-IIB family hydrolase [candidate division Zixibacteria bacterium]NIU16859.1 HAD-IIB family hydrolase [candidate division Zixibacteria bacterium]NIV09021.1 HAD-IIB family hydrolase [candidate division Zixibacteria bacterium]
LELVRKLKIPLVICTSKTRAEVEVYRRKLDTEHPFIAENGGGIYSPRNYFKNISMYSPESAHGYEVIILGTPYHKLRHTLVELREEGFGVRGFGDMTAGEISSLTGLSNEEASLAKQRDFDEAFIFKGNPVQLRKAVHEHGLNLTEGRLYHLLGGNDKGKAMDIIRELYLLEDPDTVFIALGDSPTDAPMLQRADYPVLIRKDDGTYDDRVTAPGIRKTKSPGPKGWNEAVMEILSRLGLT